MLYYVALLWNRNDARACLQGQQLLTRFRSASPDWQTVVDATGLAICVQTSSSDIDRLYSLPDNQGLIIGRLFERSYVDENHPQVAPRAVVLDRARACEVVRSSGSNLLRDFWGRYVAFLHDVETGVTRVMRDPTGGVPCQHLRLGAVDVYFVRIEDCRRLGRLALSVNQHYLLGYLLFDSVCVNETGLTEVETVLAGECVEHRGQQRRRAFLWNPLEISASDAMEDEREAVRAVQQVTQACIHAWASCFEGILLDLSGGLDSSIVATCLADAPTRPRVVCRHNYAPGKDLDEREFARLAAASGGVELVEQRMDPRFKIAASIDDLDCVSPFPHLFDPEQGRTTVRFMSERGLTAHFSGDGGDEVFCRTNPLPTAVDYAWRHGASRKLLSIAIDDAVAARVSVWLMLRRVMRFGIRRHPWRLTSLLGSAHLPLLTEAPRRRACGDAGLWHPLFRGQSRIEPGKFMHAYSLALGAARGFVPVAGATAYPYITPLLSQPLIELCLRIPVYLHASRGRDRSLARQAFASRLPTRIHSRRSKGFGNSFMQAALTQQMELARELLADGFLVRAGWLDRGRLEAALSGHVSSDSPDAIELATYLDVEMWVRCWERCRDDRAAA